MNDPEKLVNNLLSEAPVEPDQVGNPGASGPTVYRMVKSEDIEMSEELEQHLGEIIEDDRVVWAGDLQQLADEFFAEECARLSAQMERLGVDCILIS